MDSADIHVLSQFFEAVWPIIVALATGIGGAWAFFKKFQKEAKDSIDNKIKSYYDAIVKDAEDLKSENAALIKAQQELSIDYATMKTKWDLIVGTTEPEDLTVEKLMDLGRAQRRAMDVLKEFTITFPGLLWIKRRKKNAEWEMFAISRAYTEMYLKELPEYYIGKTDSEIWPPEIAETFRKNDEEAHQRGVPIYVEEEVKSTAGKVGMFIGWKWSFKIDGEIYSCGYGTHHDKDSYKYMKEKTAKDEKIE